MLAAGIELQTEVSLVRCHRLASDRCSSLFAWMKRIAAGQADASERWMEEHCYWYLAIAEELQICLTLAAVAGSVSVEAEERSICRIHV